MNITEKMFGIEKKVEAKFNDMLHNMQFMKTFKEITGFGTDKERKYSKSPDKTGKSYTDLYTEEIYIYGCVYLISNTIAKLDLRIYQDVKNPEGQIEKKDITDTHPASALFHKPNFKDTFYDLKEQVSANLELTGNSYLLLDQQDSKGRPKAIYCLNSRCIEIIATTGKESIQSLTDMIEAYKYGTKKYEISQVIQEKKFGVDSELYGQSPVMVASQLVDTTRESRTRNISIFSNGLSGESAFETEQQYNDVAYKRLKQDIAEKYQGAKNYHQPYILFGGLKLKNIGVSQKDLEFIQGMKLSREEICGFIYQVPPILLGVLENSSYNNIKEATKIFYNFSIKPRLVKIEEMFQKLIDLYEVKDAYCEFDLSDVEELRENISDKITSAQQLFNIGVPLNQIIGALNLPFKPVEGGDTGFIPFSLMPLGRTKPEKPTTPVPPEETPKEEEGKNVKPKVKAYTEKMLEAKWKQFASTTAKNENLYKSDLHKFFKDQWERVIDNASEFKSLKPQKIGDNAFAIVGEDFIGKKRTVNINSILFDENEEVEKMLKVSIPNYENAVKETADAEFDLMGIEMSFDVQNPEVQKWLKQYGLDKCTSVTETLHEELKDSLIEGLNAGESINQLMERIDDVYTDKLEDYQLERIARTEIIGASNQGALFSYKDAGVEFKSWLSASDERVRDTHFKASVDYVQGIPINEDFKVGADQMVAPCQGNLPEENINCRCTLIPVIKEAE